MNILILDDEEHRHSTLEQFHPRAIFTHVYTAKNCISILKSNPSFDLVYLDHDLEELLEDGTKVAKALAALPQDQQPKRIIIHSMNPEAALRMAGILSTAALPVLVTPFEELKKLL